ncbi:MAG TPA: VCBS repeat-containing protein, partial [Chitinophagaceae bacterium]|nr:VCBS repeat-containing protein [Chitinophagaceae bacterium]
REPVMFTDVSAEAGIYQSNLGYGLGLAIADLNNDGWEDIYVGNDFHENDYYYVNNGNGKFSEGGADYFDHYSRFSMGNDIADYDNDGQLDVITVDMLPPDEKVLKTYGSDENPDIYKVKLEMNGYQKQYSRNCLHRNNGNGTSFSETALLSGVSATDWSWAPLFADFDNDGSKDLLITSGIVKRPVDLDYVRYVSDLQVKKGMNATDKYDDMALEKMPDGSSHPFLYKGHSNFQFEDVSESWGTSKLKGYSNGAAYTDLDNDGDLDLVINNLDAVASILRNNSPSRNYISISFKGDSLNTSGIGAKAYLFTRNNLQYQQLMMTRGFQSSIEPKLHFGLNNLATVDSILIVWPDQRFQVLKNVPANKPLVAMKKDASGNFKHEEFFKPAPSILSELTDVYSVEWKHRENDFLDYNVQYLIPHGQSDRGPKIAIADVNGDGLDDLYACGAVGQPGTLLIQRSFGKFSAADTALFNADAACEDVDAVFFDANGDGYPDLYVANGGNQYLEHSRMLQDRLYLNDGKGHFTKSPAGIPPVLKNKSCVTAADIDKDGDVDLFVGVLADARAFGVPQSSALLLNDGKANFSVAGENVISLSKIGMVTSALFGDINKDGWPDLAVAGEWMPLTIYLNEKGKFKSSVIPNSTGWWQTILLEDINGDGQLDILAGNWGWNNKFWAG